MCSKNKQELVLFLANIGEQHGDSEYVSKTKEVMKLIIEKKIFLRPKDTIGIILGGCWDEESNSINDRCTVRFQDVQIPTWDMVRKIIDIQENKQNPFNWLEALTEFLEYLEETTKDEIRRCNAIMLFDCKSSCPGIRSVDKRAIANKFIEHDIQPLWIGSKDLAGMSPDMRNESEKVLMEILEMANGKYMTMEQTLPLLRIFKQNKTRVMAWKCMLQIGCIEIPTATYIQASSTNKGPKIKFTHVNGNGSEIFENTSNRSERMYVDKHRNIYPESETITGYKYGRKFVPLSDADRERLKNKDEVKSFQVVGFVSVDSIQIQDLGGNSSRITIPDGTWAERPFYCLAQAMKDADLVAIARRVYRNKGTVKMCALFPHVGVEGEISCLIVLDTLYATNRRVADPVPLEHIFATLKKEEMEAMDNLIDSMTLTDSCGAEPFAPGTVPSPKLQHMWNSLAFRALNPSVPLQPVEDYLKQLVEVPKSIRMKSEKYLNEILSLFNFDERGESDKAATDTEDKTATAFANLFSQEESLDLEYSQLVDLLNEPSQN